MESYQGIIEKYDLVITRTENPFSEEVEWCVGKLLRGGTIEAKSFGKTIEKALERAYKLIEG